MRSNFKSTPEIAIVSTMADAGEHLDFFIQYHKAIGISWFYIFNDDNSQETFNIANKYKNVKVIHKDKEYFEKVKETPVFENTKKRNLLEKEVMVRQEANVYIAAAEATLKGIDWLIHIDIDELFFLNGNNIYDHFKELDRKSIGGFNYVNYEAITTGLGNDCIYSSTQYFKKNYFRRGAWFFSEQQKKIIKSIPNLSKLYFNYYQNGKSSFPLKNKIVVHDVHAIRSEGKTLKLGDHTSPIVLHFPCSNFTQFWKKYERLGDFEDNWNGKPRAGKFIDKFHLLARDTYLENNELLMQNLYKERLMLSPKSIKTLIDAGLVVELSDIKNFEEERIEACNSLPNVEQAQVLVYPEIQSAFEKCSYLEDYYVKNSALSGEFIHFSDSNDLVGWQRKHVLLKQRNDIGKKSDGLNIFPMLNGKLILDCSIKSAVDYIRNIILFHEDDKWLIIDIENAIQFSSQSSSQNTSLHQYRVNQIRFVTEVLDKCSDYSRARVVLKVAKQYAIYFALKKFGYNVIYSDMFDTLHDSADEGKWLTEYFYKCLPLRNGLNLCIDENTVKEKGKNYSDCFYSVLYFVAVSILNRKMENEGNVECYFEARKKYQAILKLNAKIEIFEKGKYCLIKKYDDRFKYYCCVNLSTEYKNIRSILGQENRSLVGKPFLDMIANKKMIIDETIFLEPRSSKWLRVCLR